MKFAIKTCFYYQIICWENCEWFSFFLFQRNFRKIREIMCHSRDTNIRAQLFVLGVYYNLSQIWKAISNCYAFLRAWSRATPKVQFSCLAYRIGSYQTCLFFLINEANLIVTFSHCFNITGKVSIDENKQGEKGYFIIVQSNQRKNSSLLSFLFIFLLLSVILSKYLPEPYYLNFTNKKKLVNMPGIIWLKEL